VSPVTHSRRERALWHDSNFHTPCIGCPQCPDHSVCSGLQLQAPLYNCLSFCCQNPQDCDRVCRNNPAKLAQRVRGVDGFLLDNVPRNSVLPVPVLPALLPRIYDGLRRTKPLPASGVCLPLYSVLERHNGGARYSSAQAVARSPIPSAIASTMLKMTTPNALSRQRWPRLHRVPCLPEIENRNA